MALRGALNRKFNISLGIVMILCGSLMVYSGYALGSSTARIVLINILVGFPSGALAGVPAFLMNRRALTELYDALNGKVFLSSQLALLDSRHGKNAVVYFYFLWYLAYVAHAFLPDIWNYAAAFFAYGAYLSANILPFVFFRKQ